MTAEHVKALQQASTNYLQAYARAEQLRPLRDDAIRECIKQGMSHAEIYRALDGSIGRARIGQIALEHPAM